MIKLCFFDYGNHDLDVEKELMIDVDVIDFITDQIQNISFDSTSNEADLEDDWIYWFNSNDENEAVCKLDKLISSKIKKGSKLKYKIEIDEM